MRFARLLHPAAFAGLLLSATTAFAQSGTITVTAAQILNFRLGDTTTRFGAFEFVGGLELSSETGTFGGFSGLRLHPDRNNLLAVSDKCRLLSAVLQRDITGALQNVADVRLAPLPDGRSGKPLSKNGYSDCEALDVANDKAYLAFERNNEIGGFGIGPAGVLTDFTQQSPKGGIGRLDRNRGIEAMAAFPQSSPFAGGFVSISEETLDKAGNHRAFITFAGQVAEFSIQRRDDFSVTDAAFTPDGDLLILERRFNLSSAPAMRIRRLSGAAIAQGALLDGDVLLEAGIAHRIDNMEGIAVSQDETGQVYVTLISDDNFNFFQRTLLLEFRLVQ